MKKHIATVKYDDGCAYGIQVLVDGEVVCLIDIMTNGGEIRVIPYKEGSDEPVDIISVNR